MSAIITGVVYADERQLQDFLQLTGFFDAQSIPSAGVMRQYIRLAEGDLEAVTGTAWKPRFVQDEVHDVESIRERFFDFPDYDFLPHPFKLEHYPLIVPLDPARGHRLEVYEGGVTTPTPQDPVGRWTDWLTTQTYGRNRGYDYDRWQEGEIRVRKFLIRRASMLRVSYEYGKPITTVSATLAPGATIIPCVSTFRYETRGVIRIGNQRIFHTGKTATSFTGCTTGYEGTEDVTIPSGSEIYEVPDDVTRLTLIRAGMRFLQNDRYAAKAAEGQLSSQGIQDTIRDWQQEWREGIAKYQRWGLV